MDIERKCFEESNNVNPDWSFKFDEELQQYIALDSEMELQVDEFNELWDAFRAGWQAAKAQAVPEGFVLVPKEPNLEFKGRLRSYLDNLWMGEWGCDWDGFICVSGIDPNEIWQFMIEAQEQAND